MTGTALISLLTLCHLTTAFPMSWSLPILSNLAVTPQSSPPASALPAPSPSLQLRYIALGLGTQNYTCASSSSAPTAIGALATLYDATAAMLAASATQTDMATAPCAADKADQVLPLAVLGHHFFSSAGVPTFDLSQGSKSPAFPDGMFASVKKVQATPAPSTACEGRDGAAAVPWLYLVDDGRGVSRGVSQVFRVETAGGSAPASCEAAGTVTQDYSALYYFYG